MNLSSFLAWNYLWFRKKDKSISFMIRICFLGIFIGTFSLMLTLIVMNGFEKVIHEKMQGITSEVVIRAPGKKLDDTSIKEILNTEFKAMVRTASSSTMKQVIIDHNKQQSILFIKGVEPETEGMVSTIEDKVVLPHYSKEKLRTLLQGNRILVGYKMAQMHNLALGSEVTLLIPDPGRRSISLSKKKAVVGGIFKVGLEEYDNNFAYCSLELMKKMFGKEKGVDRIALALRKDRMSFFQKVRSLVPFGVPDYQRQCVNELQARLPGITVNSWKDLYPALVESLWLEKYLMFFILLLISLVACMNMISLLFMQIQQKRRDIAIFKAMGMAYGQIKWIFLRIGLSITFVASLLGLGCAALAGYLLERYPFIKIPNVYFVSHLPARMEPEIFVVVFVCTMLLGFLATWIPVRRTKKFMWLMCCAKNKGV